jgi:hypothetical protein
LCQNVFWGNQNQLAVGLSSVTLTVINNLTDETTMDTLLSEYSITSPSITFSPKTQTRLQNPHHLTLLHPTTISRAPQSFERLHPQLDLEGPANEPIRTNSSDTPKP